MASTFSYVPPAHTGMSAVQWHITFRQRRTTATSRLTTAVAPAASAGPEMVSAAKSRQAQAGPRVPPVKGPAMVNTFNLSCSSDTDVAVGLAIADKQRAGLVGDQTAPRMLFTDRREEVSTGVDAAVPVAGGDSLEVPAAQMQESSQQVLCPLSCCFVFCLRQILCFLCMLGVEFQGRIDQTMMLAQVLPSARQGFLSC